MVFILIQLEGDASQNQGVDVYFCSSPAAAFSMLMLMPELTGFTLTVSTSLLVMAFQSLTPFPGSRDHGFDATQSSGESPFRVLRQAKRPSNITKC
jgi:hypothetical protein